ncbi:hypothetical protein B7H23_14460 [Notoacmeibacter marinus]|uniref:DUF2062 domain-containing protein n=1 Tax=Notoacmeibacter marinus TaxID=1876515 RepID=A0A231UTY7_9HYPH|nr:DUF2062 domain-containing protein [Notoacmeibacter marinus]OXS99363.1 hypothetical protein B7H23_14460 [Notoacmeibacter marinus]
MLFRRRRAETGWKRFRIAVWPRRSWSRSTSYFAKRVLRLSGSPHAIAAGVAAGVFASFTPYLGFHIIGAAAVAWLIGGNIIASALGTFAGNPLTFPLIWATTLETGRYLLGYSAAPSDRWIGRRLMHMEFDALWQPLLKPMTVGGLLWGVVAALTTYALLRGSIAAFQQQRRRRLLERAKARARLQGETLSRQKSTAAT